MEYSSIKYSDCKWMSEQASAYACVCVCYLNSF